VRDLSYLQAFSPKSLREARRILKEGFTAEDITTFLAGSFERTMKNASPERKRQFVEDMKKRGWILKKPCGGCKKEAKAWLM